MNRRMPGVAIVVVMILATLPVAAPAHAWSHGSCVFHGTNWMSGGKGFAKTTEWDFSCASVSAQAKYKVDGYWYSTENAYGGRWVIQETPRVYPNDVTGAHRGKDVTQGWSPYRYSY